MNNTENTANNNGYDYVDLELPSGTLWATCNVGASKPSDYGQYFQWGDTQGYTADQIGTSEGKKEFASDWGDYKWGKVQDFKKYSTSCEILDLEDDAAHVNMGGSWHMPSSEQIRELVANTTRKWIALDGVSGMAFTSKKDNSKSIFIPAAGCAWDGCVVLSHRGGYIWSCMLSKNFVNKSQSLYLDSRCTGYGCGFRCDGRTVRGVIGYN